MAFSYAGFAQLALSQIDDKGRTVKLIYTTQDKYDPSTDTIIRATSEHAEIKALAVNYAMSEVDGTNIINGDKLFLVAAKGVTKPSIADIILDDDEYGIVNIEEVKTGDTAILYRLQVRR